MRLLFPSGAYDRPLFSDYEQSDICISFAYIMLQVLPPGRTQEVKYISHPSHDNRQQRLCLGDCPSSCQSVCAHSPLANAWRTYAACPRMPRKPRRDDTTVLLHSLLMANRFEPNCLRCIGNRRVLSGIGIEPLKEALTKPQPPKETINACFEICFSRVGTLVGHTVPPN